MKYCQVNKESSNLHIANDTLSPSKLPNKGQYVKIAFTAWATQ
jgi:hypothetical protein